MVYHSERIETNAINREPIRQNKYSVPIKKNDIDIYMCLYKKMYEI